MRGQSGIGRIVGAFMLAVVAGSMLTSTADAQGLSTVEPTLAECEAFVQENGVPSERPVAQNRGYSGYDICLNMAYDGDLPGYFASADANGDGVLQSDEQRVYLDGVIGLVSDPDQSALTVAKCEALVSQYGIPAARPFVDWGNRGYGEVEICQALAYDGDLAGSFATWDSNGDGRLDRSETAAAVEGFKQAGTSRDTGEAGGSGLADPEVPGDAGGSQQTPGTGSAGEATAGESTAGTSAGDQYGEATGQVEPEATIPPYGTGETTAATDSGADTAQPDATGEPEGIVASVGSFISNALPTTGGIALLGIAGGVVVIGGGLLAFRFLR